jgi:uncharacterized cupredoxin-like copper-binding protein
VPHALQRPAALAAVAALSLLVACGCGSASPATPAGAKVVNVREGDFHIKAPKELPSGDVVLSVHNQGPDDHELLVIREAGGGEEEEEEHTKLREDGMTVDEDGLGKAVVGALEPGEPNTVRRLRVRLKPGRYELICNMSGHYFGGMETDVTVN